MILVLPFTTKMGYAFCEIVKMTTILSSTMRQIHLDIRKGSLPRNFTVIVIELWRKMVSWSTSMGVPSLTRMSRLAEVCIARSIKHFQSVGSIRPIFQLAQLAIGCLDLHRRNTTLSKILTRKAGKNASFSQNTILQTYTWEPLCCPSMLRTF